MKVLLSLGALEEPLSVSEVWNGRGGRILCARNERRTPRRYPREWRTRTSHHRGGEEGRRNALNCKQSTVTLVPSVLSLLLDSSALSWLARRILSFGSLPELLAGHGLWCLFTWLFILTFSYKMIDLLLILYDTLSLFVEHLKFAHFCGLDVSFVWAHNIK